MIDLRVCVLGDSYVLGQGDDTGLGWTGRVLASARAEGIDLTLYNLGVRRETGPQIAARLHEVEPRLALGDRKAVVVAFGSNDLSLGVPTQASIGALETILRDAARQERAAFVLSPPAFPNEPELDYRAGVLSAALAETCAATPYLNLREVVPNWGRWWEEAVAGDGSHPNSGGYSLISDAFTAWAPWRTWLGLQVRGSTRASGPAHHDQPTTKLVILSRRVAPCRRTQGAGRY